MAPKCDLLTAGTTPITKPQPLGRKPITTKEKMDAFAAQKFKSKAKALSPPPDVSTDKVGKKPKIKPLPPPGEVFQTPKPKPKVTGLGSARSRKAYTTKEKIDELKIGKRITAKVERKRKSDAKKAKEASVGKGDGKKDEAVKGGKKGKSKSSFPSTWDLLTMSSEPTATKFKDTKRGVLMRPTARAVAEKQALANKNVDVAQAPMVTKPGEKQKEKKAFRIMDLPEEIRNRIWKMAVVHHPFCVWPNQRKGKEQPDLAMSGRETRDEVLPVYYGVNVFGVDITPLPVEPEPKQQEMKAASEISEKDGKNGATFPNDEPASTIPKPENTQKPADKPATKPIPDAIAEIKPWAKALEKEGHLSEIQHWVFSSTPEIVVAGRIPQIDEQKSFVVYLNIWRDSADASWRANVELHREACCILPGQDEYQKCVIENSPNWLNGMVDCVLRAAGKRGIIAEMVDGVAKVLRQRAEDLAPVKCASVSK